MPTSRWWVVANHFHRSPDQLGPEEIRAYQVYLFTERKLGARTVGHHTAALRFFFCKTLNRNYPVEEVPYPRASRRLPIILTQEEAVRLIDSASNLFHRAMLMTLYSTGMRRAELCHLKVEDIDSDRMIIHNRAMPVFMCRWPNGDVSFVFARNKEDAIITLDEFDNAELAKLVQIGSFMLDFRLTDDGELVFQGFGEDCQAEIMQRAYPVVAAALADVPRISAGVPTAKGKR
jgi:hypothetical protein